MHFAFPPIHLLPAMKYLGIVITLIAIAPYSLAQSQPSVYVELETYYNANSYDACVRMRKGVESFTRNRIDTLAANSFFYLGDAYHQIGDIDNALHFFELERKTLRALNLHRTTDFSNTLNNLAYLYLQAGHYNKAGLIADELLQNERSLFPPTSAEYVSSVISVADIYIQLDRNKEAEQILAHALRSQRRDSVHRGVLLNKIGDLYTYTGQYTRALKALTEALDIHAEQAGEESSEYTNAAINLGILYMNQGKYAEAEEIFEVALSRVDQSETAYTSLLNNHALVSQGVGQLDRAEKTLRMIKERDSIELGVTHPDYAITLTNLGLLYADQSKYELAESNLKNALKIQEQNGEGATTSYARKLNNLAKLHQMKGLPKKAIPLLEEALGIFRKNMGKESPEYATSAYNLGVALWKAGNGEAGYKYLRLSASIRAKTLGRKHPRYAESILKIAEYQWERNNVSEAHKSFGEVFENYYFQIDETFPVLTEEEKSRFYYTNIRASFDKFNSFAIQNLNTNPEVVNDVYNHLINTKGAIMFATEKVRASILTSGDVQLIQRFEEWQEVKEQIARLYSLNQERGRLDSLLAYADLMEKELARNSAVFSRQFIRGRATFEAIQKKLKPGEAAVEVLRYKKFNTAEGGSFSEEPSYAFLVLTSTEEQPRLLSMPNGGDMEVKYLKYYRNNIKYNLEDPASYEHYFKPLAEYLKNEKVSTVFFSPDGVYNQININSIQDPETKKYIIEDFHIRQLTNTREVAEVNLSTDKRQASTLIGFPKFNLDEAELPEIKRTSTSRGVTKRAWRGGLLRYMRGEEGISILPGTEIEIEKIAELFGEATSVYIGGHATERIAKTTKNPAVLHIATHGYFLEDEMEAGSVGGYYSNPLLNAGLILAGAENFLKTGEAINAEGDDGILTAFEAMNMDLENTQLVVLSACETALGNIRNGEGVYGLQRALKLAGAKSIVMSLWSVDDDATQQLMTSFYEEMFRTGNQHQAFRTAQMKVKEKYPSPFFWGAFVMVGI